MGKLGKLLLISPTRSIYIEDQDGEYIKDNTIIYRNVGKDYDVKYQIQANVEIKDNVIDVLDDYGLPVVDDINGWNIKVIELNKIL